MPLPGCEPNLLPSLVKRRADESARGYSYDVYGIDAAQPDYSYPGNPAGLIRVDTILGSTSSPFTRYPP